VDLECYVPGGRFPGNVAYMHVDTLTDCVTVISMVIASHTDIYTGAKTDSLTLNGISYLYQSLSNRQDILP